MTDSLNREVGELTKTIQIQTEAQKDFNKELIEAIKDCSDRITSLEMSRVSGQSIWKAASFIGGFIGACITSVVTYISYRH